MKKTIRVTIFGATGYTGVELYRRLKVRSDVEIAYLVSKSYAGQSYQKVLGAFSSEADEILVDGKNDEVISQVDVVFTALPHGHAFEIARRVKQYGKKLIDLGADFRLKDSAEYESWYQVEHRAVDLLKEAVYSIPELHRQRIKENTWLVANPGCYTTSVQLALAPLIEADLIEVDKLIIDAKSGVSGAGRGLGLTTHYSEANESVNAYGVGTHRHTPEIEEQLSYFSDDAVKIIFAPHLMPMTRGIHSTIYCSLKDGVKEEMIRVALEKKYQNEKFVTVLEQGVYPKTKWVSGSNHCLLNFIIDPRTGLLVLFSVIDNLGKGAAGQGIQNMNILCGCQEEDGLRELPIFP